MTHFKKILFPILTLIVTLANATTVSAEELVGKVTAVSDDSRSIDVEDRRYRITSAALQGPGPNMKNRLRLDQLAEGQIVTIKTSGESIIVLELLHGYNDIPN